MATARSMFLANILPLAAVQALMLPRADLFCQLDAVDFLPALANYDPALEYCSSSFPVPATTATVTPITDAFTTITRTVTVFSSLITPVVATDTELPTVIIDPPVTKVKRSEGGENEEARRGLLDGFFGDRFPGSGHQHHWPDFVPGRGGNGGGGYTNNNAGYGGESPYGDDYDDGGDEYDDGEGDTPDGTWYPAPAPETTSADVDPTFIIPTITLPTITDPLPTISSLVSSLTSDLGPIESSLSSSIASVLSSLTSDIDTVLPTVLPSLTSDLPIPTVTPFTTSAITTGGGGDSALSSLQSLDAVFQGSICSCIEDAPTFTITGVPTATGLLTAVETVTVTLPRPRHGIY
ncbi:hypothetical protein PFICI_03665 [Pestalotiopsis fici W106-1]|uniref:Uncharacterized protein n=1 Tax=Pestalotiopsis fici (strain W106-1 / CGMCC3.15140) TaxID=1229662 RepID=W3XHZ5_PESFW|nr:uncharacterized protein PFICI_03665 [Pestalotiopsis fici W106-1]ETS85640.1 hypothetical protein PFICI_03665 [Pestalotiopsis fici W106-1]